MLSIAQTTWAEDTAFNRVIFNPAVLCFPTELEFYT